MAKKLGNRGVSTVFGSILFMILVVTLASILFFALYTFNNQVQESIKLEEERRQEGIVLYGLATQNLSEAEYITEIFVNNTGSITSRIRAIYIDSEFLCDPSDPTINLDDTYINEKESTRILVPPGVEYEATAKMTVATERGIKSTEYEWRLKHGGGSPPNYEQRGSYFGPLWLDFNEFYFTECDPKNGSYDPSTWKPGWKIEVGTGTIAWNITVKNVDDRNITINHFSCFTLFPNQSPSNRRAWYIEPLTEPLTQFIKVNETVNIIYIWSKPKSVSTAPQDIYNTVCRNKVFLTFFGVFHEHDGTTKPYGQTIPFEAVLCVKTYPVASFTESAETVYTDEAINFNAANSFDPDGYIVNYFWDFGDGSNATGVAVSHAYSENGIYTVTLTVTDNENKTGSATATKTVLNRLSIPSFSESAETVYTGEIIFFDASGSYDPDGTIVSYQWNFGDGTNAAGITASHSYADDGIYTVTLTVTDDDGATASTTAVKTVLNRLPFAVFTESAETVYIGETITFNASESYDSDGYIVDYFWDFGDGSNATGVVVSHAYSYNGTYTVTLTVTDDDGATAPATALKTVLNSTATSFTEFLSANNSVCTVRSTGDYGTPKTMALTSGARKDLSNDVGGNQ